MQSYYDIDIFPAGLLRRLMAFIIDSFMSFLPLLVVLLLLTSDYRGDAYKAPLFHSVPLIGLITVIDVPGNVHKALNNPPNDAGGTYDAYDVSPGATAKRMLSVVVVAFYVLYGTFTTCIFEGHTFGKYLMKITTVAVDTKKPMLKLLLRELVGKVLLNSIPLIPIISIFTILFTPSHLAIHDLIFKTRVAELTDSQL